MKIKIIIDTYTTKPDGHGNRYSACTITNPANGRSVNLSLGWGGGSNVAHYARKFGFAWDEIHSTAAGELKKSELARIEKTAIGYDADFDAACNSIGLRKRKEALA